MVAKSRRALTLPLLLAFLASAFADRYGVAVIVGSQEYESERVPDVAFAHRDAEAFKRYVLEVLGDRIRTRPSRGR